MYLVQTPKGRTRNQYRNMNAQYIAVLSVGKMQEKLCFTCNYIIDPNMQPRPDRATDANKNTV